MAARPVPFSMRLPAETDELISAEARRARRSKGALVTELAEEALRCRLLPGIAFRGRDPRRAWVVGTALDVSQLVEIHDALGSIEQVTESFSVTEGQLRTALAYRERFPDEIDELTAENRASIDELRRRYPHIELIERAG